MARTPHNYHRPTVRKRDGAAHGNIDVEREYSQRYASRDFYDRYRRENYDNPYTDAYDSSSRYDTPDAYDNHAAYDNESLEAQSFAGNSHTRARRSVHKRTNATPRSRAAGEDTAASYSRDSYGSGASRRSVRSAAGSRKRGGKLRFVVIAVLALVLLGAGAAFAATHYINSNLSEGLDDNLDNVLVETKLTKEPFYMLLLGTDSSLERENDASYGESFRTDTIILARIDPVNKKVTLVSMPRDTMVDMGTYGTQKLNSAYSFGGASLAVQEVSSLAGVDISHFCIIDMDGLTSVVDGLGGIEVDVPMEINDEDAGGHVDAGLQTLNGQQALILCRARNCFEEVGVIGDYARSANQRLVMQAIANKVLSSDLATIASTMKDLSQYVSTDLSVTDIVGLAQAMKDMDTSNDIYTGTMPTTSQYINDLWYEVIDYESWWTMMERVEQGLPPTEESEYDETTGLLLANAGDAEGQQLSESSDSSTTDASDATICVLNGTDVAGLAESAANQLESAGYTIDRFDNADSETYTQTVVVYMNDKYSRTAQTLAGVLGDNVLAMANDGSYVSDADIVVILGSDWA